MSAESRTPSGRETLIAMWFMGSGILTGWITCSLFWLFMGWLP